MKHRPDWDNPNWDPSKTIRPRPRAKSLREDELLLLNVFHYLLRRHGIRNTRKMFANFAREPNKEQRRELERLETLKRLDAMKRPNLNQLARDLLAAEGITDEHRNFQRLFEARRKQIKRWKDKRAEIEAKFAGISPPTAKDEPVEFIVHEKGTSRRR